MKIEHIAMYVNDLERAKDFFMLDILIKQPVFVLIF